MSDVVDMAVSALNEKIGGSFDGTALFVIEDEGAVLIDGDGARKTAEETEADVTMTADTDTFKSILGGEMDPTAAFMSGKLRIDGDMGMAMKLGAVLG